MNRQLSVGRTFIGFELVDSLSSFYSTDYYSSKLYEIMLGKNLCKIVSNNLLFMAYQVDH